MVVDAVTNEDSISTIESDVEELVENITTLREVTQEIDNLYIGGDGHDTLSYATATHAVTIDIVSGIATGADIGTDGFAEIEAFEGGSGDDTFIVGAGAVSLDGRSGNDMFVFLADATISSDPASRHSINSFEVGDVVRMSKYDIFERAVDELEDAFEDVYGSNIAQDDMDDIVIPIRVRHESIDDIMETFVEADFDGDAVFEISIRLDGHHDLVIISNNTTGA